MSEKTIITRAQSEAINNALADYSKDDLLYAHLDDYRQGLKGFGGESSPLNEMSPVELAKALYGPYEILEDLETFTIPVKWEMEAEVTVHANSLEEAIQIVIDQDNFPDGEYVESSFEVCSALIEELDQYGESPEESAPVEEPEKKFTLDYPEISIPTNNGLIEVFKTSGKQYPGIYIYINKEQALLIDTYNDVDGPITARVWGNPDIEDYSYSKSFYKPADAE